MGALLGIPPRFMLVIILVIAAYVVYHMVSTHTAQPLYIIILIILEFALARLLFKMRPKAQIDDDDDE